MKKNQTTLVQEYHLPACKVLFAGFILLMILLSPSFLAAQQVKEMGTLLEEMKQSADAGVRAEAVRLSSLSYDLNSTVYVNSDEIKAFGEGNPVCAEVDTNAISKLYDENPLFGQVELITVRIKDMAGLSNKLDLSALAGFTNLKYIRVLCEINCTAAQVEAMLTGSNANVAACYLVSMPQ